MFVCSIWDRTAITFSREYCETALHHSSLSLSILCDFRFRFLPMFTMATDLAVRTQIKDTLWVLRRDELLVHVSVDILLITKHILDHVISLES